MSDVKTTSTPDATYGTSLPSMPGYKTYLVAVAGILVSAVFPILHNLWPWFPSLDVNETTAVLGTFVSLAFVFHRFGMNAVGKYILQNVWPSIEPQLESSVKRILQQELQTVAIQSVGAGADAQAIADVIYMVGLDPTSDKAKLVRARLTAIPTP